MHKALSAVLVGLLCVACGSSGSSGGNEHDAGAAQPMDSGSGSAMNGGQNMDGGATADAFTQAESVDAADMDAESTSMQGDAGQSLDASDAEIDAGNTLSVSAIAAQVVNPGSSVGPLAFTISGGTGNYSVSVATKTKLAQTVYEIDPKDVQLGGSGSARTVTVSPNKSTIPLSYLAVISVDDGETKAQTSFVLRVNAPPVILTVADQGALTDGTLPPFNVHLYDGDSASGTLLTLTGSSSDQSVLADSAIQIGPTILDNSPGAGHSWRTLTLSPNTAQPASATVTLKVTDADGGSSSLTFAVKITDTPQNGLDLVSRKGGVSYEEGDDKSLDPDVSDDGRFVVFASSAKNLLPNVTPAYTDLFVRDRQSKTLKVLTNSLGRNEAPDITPDARFVAFVSTSPSLVAGDTNGVGDVFVYDRSNDTLERVSVSSDEAQADATSAIDVYQGISYVRPAISDDGRYVAFLSAASNLVDGDSNGAVDAFVRDRSAGTTTRVSVSSSGDQANAPIIDVALSGDGKVVAFSSAATNLIDGESEADARNDLFAREGSVTTRISSANAGGPGDGESYAPSLSTSGRYVAFVSAATNFESTKDTYGKVDVWIRDRETGSCERINLDLDPNGSQGYCMTPSLSGDGVRVLFSTQGFRTGEISDANQAYVWDRDKKLFTFLGESFVGGVANGGTGYGLRIAASGKFAVFQSGASNLFPDDGNSAIDVFFSTLP